MKKTILAALLTVISAVAIASPVPKMDIVDTAISTGQFKTLVAAVSAAGLVDTLKSKGPFTVLAPTDAAFAKLPAGTVDALLNDIPTLTKILTYHVVAGQLSSCDLVKLGTVKTVQGQNIEISYKNKALYINDSQVVMYNIKTTNGIIQVLDSVLLPQ